MFGTGPSLADIAAVTGNNRNNDGWGDGNDWWVLIILFALFGGWGRNGFGGNEGSSCCAPATCADLQRGFDNQTTQMRFNGIDQGLCSLGYDNAVLTNGVNTNIMQTGFGIQNAITTAVNQGFAQLDRTIADQFCQLKMEQKDAKIAEQQNLINALNLAQSQANQNQYLVDQLRPCPTPAYITCNPWATNGTAYNGCCGQNCVC